MQSESWRRRANCGVCGAGESRVIHRETHHETLDPRLKPYFAREAKLRLCGSCGFAWVDEVPESADFYQALYSSNRDVSIDFDHSGKLAIFRKIKERLESYTDERDLLDLGTGTGRFLAELGSAWRAQGIELDEQQAAFARSRGLAVRAAPLERLPFEDASFGVVTLIDVLEHFIDPGAVVAECRRVLKPGGVIVIKVPDYLAQLRKQRTLQAIGLSRAGIMQDYVHINHFNARSLSRLLEARRFEELRQEWAPAEVWDLGWSQAPKGLAYRIVYNSLVSMSARLGFNRQVFGRKLP